MIFIKTLKNTIQKEKNKRKILIDFDDGIVDMLRNKKFSN